MYEGGGSGELPSLHEMKVPLEKKGSWPIWQMAQAHQLGFQSQ